MQKLDERQNQAVIKMFEDIKTYGGAFLHFDTQMGKTRTVVKFIEKYCDDRLDYLIIAPKKLHNQWKEEIGDILPDATNIRYVGIEWLARTDNKLEHNPNTIAICDEIQETKTFRKKVYNQRSLIKIGLSATPARNDYCNWFHIAKAFFPKFDFKHKNDERAWRYAYLELDEAKNAWMKTYYPITLNQWKKKPFDEQLPVIRLSRPKAHQIREVFLKHKITTPYIPLTARAGILGNYIPTSTVDYRLMKDRASYMLYDEDKKLIGINLGIIAYLRRTMEAMSNLIIVDSPDIAKYIGEYFDITYINGDTPMEDRDEMFMDDQIVATAQTVGVGVNALHHIENIIILSNITDETMLTQITGRNINHRTPKITFVKDDPNYIEGSTTYQYTSTDVKVVKPGVWE